MATPVLISEGKIPDHGGYSLIIRVDWDLPADTPWSIHSQTTCRVKVMRMTAPGVFATVAGSDIFCHSGVPQQTEDGDWATYPDPPEPGDSAAWYDNAGELLPRYHHLMVFSPRLGPGVYWAFIDVWNGAAWVAFPDATTGVAFRVLPRSRLRDVYQMRKDFPNPPYDPGPIRMDDTVEPIIAS